jgi:predicted GH43/DUF377 family glycosyl hydrolase
MTAEASLAKPVLGLKKNLWKRVILIFAAIGILGGAFGKFILKKLEQKQMQAVSMMESVALKQVPLADQLGIVTAVKKITLDGITAPYNSSIVEDGKGCYILSFRQDISNKENRYRISRAAEGEAFAPFCTYLGCVLLDKDFNQKAPCKMIDTKSEFSEDPRIVRVGSEIFVSYNDLANIPAYHRTIRLAALTENFDVKYTLEFDEGLQPTEKNWMPFEYVENGRAELYFGYNINPHKIFKVTNLKAAELEILRAPGHILYQYLPWSKKWGKPRGGTTARLVDGEYIAFFHSSYKEQKIDYYVMGAITFEGKPPFRVTRISKFPILFNGIGETPAFNTARHSLRAIYPTGLAVEEKDGKTLLHVSCGENDCATKVVTIDKEVLIGNMQEIPEVIPQPEGSFPSICLE